MVSHSLSFPGIAYSHSSFIAILFIFTSVGGQSCCFYKCLLWSHCMHSFYCIIKTPNTTVRLTDYENIYSSTIINRPTFESWSTLFTGISFIILSSSANVDGKQQSVFNDAWATSAQIVSIPSDAVKEWSVPELAVNQIIESLHQCNGHELNMRIQFKRNGPSVHLPLLIYYL